MLSRIKFIGVGVMLFCAALVAGACEDDDGGDGGSCDDDRQGFTECNVGITTCQPGQCCNGFQMCENGCLSDVNCACDQTCVKNGDVGMCQLKAEPPADTGTPNDTGTPPAEGGGDPKAACKDECDATDFFMCNSPGDLQVCYDRCDAATEAQVQQFVNCSIMTVECPRRRDCEDDLP